jgi:hypothetical protein
MNTIRKYVTLALCFGFVVRPSCAWPALDTSILLHLEEPIQGEVRSGVANVRGWAVAPAVIDHVDLQVDGTFFSKIPVGGLRPDVAAAFPGVPNAAESGFSMAFNFSELSAGQHTMTVRAFSVSGDFNEVSASFQVVRFGSPFLSDPSAIDLLPGQSSITDGNSVLIQGMQAEGVKRDLLLQWRPAKQGFEIELIQPSSVASTLTGTYQLVRSSVQCADGSIVDTEQPNISATGTMTIDGSTCTQTLSLTVNGVTVGGTFSATCLDNGYFLRITNSVTYDVVVVRRDRSLITETYVPGVSAGDCAEVDQWVKVSDSVASSQSASTQEQPTRAEPRLGSGPGLLTGDLWTTRAP